MRTHEEARRLGAQEGKRPPGERVGQNPRSREDTRGMPNCSATTRAGRMVMMP